MTELDATRLPEKRPINKAILDEYAEAFLLRWDGNSRAAYRLGLQVFFDWCEQRGIDPYSDIKRPQIELFVQYLREVRGNSYSTVSHRIGTLKVFYDIVVDDDMLPKNPTKLIRVPKKRHDLNAVKSLDRNEMQVFMHAAQAEGPQTYALMAVMGYLGLRVEEACSLNIEDCTSRSMGHQTIRFVGKGGEVFVVPQPPIITRALEKAIGDRESGPIFLRRDGSRMTRQSATRVVQRVQRRSGLPYKMTPHWLRHTSIRGAIDAGVPLRQVQLSARHRDISTTIRLYDTGRQNMDSHAVHVLAGWFGTAS